MQEADKMSYVVRKEQVKETISGNGHSSFPMLGEAQGCVNDCAGGISYYRDSVYTPPAVHDFQEGFIVLAGEGYARVGAEEFELKKETAFIVPAGVEHQLKSVSSEHPLELFWFHAK